MGDYTFIYQQTGRDAMYKTWHASEKNLLIYMHTDGGSIVFNDKIYEMKKGALCFIASGCYHYTMPDIPSAYTRTKLFFSDASLERIRRLFPPSAVPQSLDAHVVYAVLPDKVQENAARLLQSLFEDGDEGRDFALFSGTLLSLFSYLNAFSTESVMRPDSSVQKAIAYINAHIAEDITIDEICAAIPMSKYHFCRQFKKVMDITVMQYILQTRLTLAKNRLRKDKESVSEISALCGFSGVSYFCRTFKAHVGVSPLAYRNGTAFR